MPTPTTQATFLAANQEAAALATNLPIIVTASQVGDQLKRSDVVAELDTFKRLRKLAGATWRATQPTYLIGMRYDVTTLVPSFSWRRFPIEAIARDWRVSEELRQWELLGWDVTDRRQASAWSPALEAELFAPGLPPPVPYCYANAGPKTLRTVGYCIDLRKPEAVAAAVAEGVFRVEASGASMIYASAHRGFFSSPQSSRLMPGVPTPDERPITDTFYGVGEYEAGHVAVWQGLAAAGIGVAVRDYQPSWGQSMVGWPYEPTAWITGFA